MIITDYKKLHRAVVSLPDQLTPNGIEDRVVFFELHGDSQKHKQLETVLSANWGVNTENWFDDGMIYNLSSGDELIRDGMGEGNLDLRLLETGWDAGRPTYIARRRTDLFVSPQMAVFLCELLSKSEGIKN
jgi:hypothetical protein